MNQLAGRIGLVTGGGRSIGRAISLALATEGCDVVVNYVSRQADADATVDVIRKQGRRAIAVQGDVSKGADVTRLVATAESELGPIDILVNNAGKMVPETIDQMSEERWNDIIGVNLTSVFLMTQAVLAGMRARKWGRVINLSSVAAQAGSMMAVHYSAAKAGVIAATRSYARMLAKEGVTVNAIAPALVATEMLRANPNLKPDMIPVGRFGEVDECASVAVMLATNAYITGQTIAVNGGMYMG
jgi:3-oxoacyl-[acyl-carrier protein] reductase